jgi:hypothetical protein
MALRGFLGFTGYYRKLVTGYGKIAASLTRLLKKNSFLSEEEVEAAFEELKKEITNPPVLILQDFSQPFITECDGSGKCIGVVLMQNQKPIAFFSYKH